MKKFFAALLVMALVLGMVPGALAAAGDVTIYHASNDFNGYSLNDNLCQLIGNQVLYGVDDKIRVYDIASKQTTEYDASGMMDQIMNNLPASETDEEDDEKEEGSDSWGTDFAAWFTYKDQTYAIVNLSRWGENGNTMDGGHLYRLELADGKATLVEADLPALDWSPMTESDGGYTYSHYVVSGFASGDNLCLTTYDNDGNPLLVVYDLTTGRGEEHYIQDLSQTAPVGDGRVVVYQSSWSTGNVAFGIYDPKDESLDVRCSGEADMTNYTEPSGFFYRADTDTLYYILNGEIWAAPGMDTEAAQSVNDCPTGYSQGAVQMTEDGYMLLHNWNTVILRSTDPAKRTEITLYVKDYVYVNSIEDAYYDFTNAHGDVAVVVNRQGRAEDILQAMMNRDGSVDVYCMDMSSSQYNAVFERGYMVELDSSEKLVEAVNRMYPAISEAVKKDGVLYAIPVVAFGNTMGINGDALKKAGMTKDDLPKTWDGLFDFLNTLPERLEGTEVRAFESYMTRSELRSTLLDVILNSYQNYINAGEAAYAFNTPLLSGLLDRIDELDFDALDVVEMNYDEATDTWYDNYDGRTALFSSYASTVMHSYSEEAQPLLLSFGDEAPRAGIDMRVMFVNPFSAHVAESIQFLESTLNCLEMDAQYTFFTDCDEPLHYPDYDEYKVNIVNCLEEAKKNQAEADEDEKANWDEAIKWYEDQIANIDDTYWMFSPAAIEAYKAITPYLTPITYNFVNDLVLDENDPFIEIVTRYQAGECPASELLAAIDKKVQMMRLEGN